MKLRIAITLATLATLAGCGVQPSQNQWVTGISQVNTAPPGRAMAWLPPQAGQVVSVLEERRTNGLSQDIVLSGDPNVYGENKITVTTITGYDLAQKYLVPNQVDVNPVNETDIAQEIDEAFPNMKMGVGDSLERNAYGPFGYAVGKKDKVGCMFAWQIIGRSDRQHLIPDGFSNASQPTSIRVKLCRSGANPMAFVGLMRQLVVGGPGAMAQTNIGMAPPAYGSADALSAAGLGNYNSAYGQNPTNMYGQYQGMTNGNVVYNTMQPGAYGTQTAESVPLYKARHKRVVKVAHRRSHTRLAATPQIDTPPQSGINIPLPDSDVSSSLAVPSQATYVAPSVSYNASSDSVTVPMPQ